MPLYGSKAQPRSGIHTKETKAELSPLELGPVPNALKGTPDGTRWGWLGGFCPAGRGTMSLHLRLLDVLSSGIAAHPQRFVVVDHDVSCPTGSLQGEKAKSENHRHSLVVLGVGQQGQAAHLPSPAPRPPTASREQLSATPCPVPQHPARTPATREHLQPQSGRPFAADAAPSRRRHPNLPGQGEGAPVAGAAPCPPAPGAQPRAGGAAGGQSPLRCLAAGAD